MAAKNFIYHHKNSIAFIIWLLFFILVIFPYPSEGSSDFLSPEERNWLKEYDGKIRVAPDPYYPPLEYFDENGIFRGIAADYLRLIEKKLQHTFQIVRLSSFEEILEKARTHEIDVVNTVIKTSERSEYLLFTPPYIRIPNVMVVRDDFKRNITIHELKGIDGVVYQGGYAIGSVLTQQHGIDHAQPITDPVEALKDLSMGRINVVVGNLAVISHYVRQVKLANLRIAGDCEFDDSISFASRKDWPLFNRILDKALREISSEEREAISDKWIKLKVGKFYQDRRFWFSVIGSLGFFAVIITLFYFWNRTLKKQVRIKTFELMQREESLKRSEEKYRCLVENANDAIIVAQDGRLVFANPMAIEITGFSEQELMSKPFLEFIHPDDRDLVFERYRQRLKGNLSPSRYSFRMIGQDSTVKIVEISAVLIDWEDRPATLNFICDITERKRMEEALNESEEKYRVSFETSPDAVNINRLDGLYVDINDGFTQLTGYSREDVNGKFSSDIKIWATPEDRDALIEGLRKNGRVNNVESKFRCKDGSFKFGLMSASIITLNNVPHILSITRDITERKKFELTILENEERWRSYVENSPYGVFITDETGKYIQVNPEACRISGYEEGELLSMKISDLLVSEFHAEGMAAFRELAEVGQIHKEIFCRTKEGEKRWWSIAAVKLPGKHYLGFTNDITERKQVEAERERLLLAIEQSGESMVITDPEGNIQYVNPAFERITGYSRKEAIGQNLRIQKSGKHDKSFYQKMWRTITSGKSWTGHIVNRRKDGSFFTEDATISPVRDSSGSIVNYVAVKRDITEHLRVLEEKADLESQFHQAQKLESIGRLAGGVAHDFNNMLGVILGHTEMALDHIDPSHPLHDSLLDIQKAAQRSADLTRQLLAFARKQAISPQVLDLNDTISGMLRMLRRIIGEGIDLVWKPGVNLWHVMMDPTQIDQILVNLAVNARDAIGRVGNLTIETQNIVFDESYCAAHAGFVPGEYVLLTVSDTGPGMDKKVLDNLFEPFFTTKEVGKGTGLGLATIYGIVRQNYGFINVYSESGVGTSFKIYLPCIQAAETAMVQAVEPEPYRGAETVLLVEDEEAILRLGKMILERYGYTVLATASPSEALIMAKQHQGPIHLLITDVVMPGINGQELKDQIISVRPEIITLFISGYTADVIAHHGVIEEDVQYLQKPFSVKTLAARVREVLDQIPPKSFENTSF